MLPILTCYHMDHSNLPSCSCISSLSNKTDMAPLSFCFIVQFQYTYKVHSRLRIVNPYPCRKQPCQLEYGAYFQLLLDLVFWAPLNSRVMYVCASSPTPFSEMVSYICNAQIVLSQSAFHPSIPLNS